MSKKKRQHRRSASSKRGTRKNSSSLVIPIAVGLVVVAIIAGVIISLENQPTAAANVPGSGGSGQAATAQPLSTGSIPHPDVRRISLEETTNKLEQGQAVLVDVRSKESYDKAHAEGAISIPELEIDSRFNELPQDIDLVLY